MEKRMEKGKKKKKKEKKRKKKRALSTSTPAHIYIYETKDPLKPYEWPLLNSVPKNQRKEDQVAEERI